MIQRVFLPALQAHGWREAQRAVRLAQGAFRVRGSGLAIGRMRSRCVRLQVRFRARRNRPRTVRSECQGSRLETPR